MTNLYGTPAKIERERRNRQIVADYKQMMTEYPGAVKSRLYEAIAEKHGVTACAVRYVLVRAGLEVTKSKKMSKYVPQKQSV